jgi:hypothetical protein
LLLLDVRYGKLQQVFCALKLVECLPVHARAQRAFHRRIGVVEQVYRSPQVIAFLARFSDAIGPSSASPT